MLAKGKRFFFAITALVIIGLVLPSWAFRAALASLPAQVNVAPDVSTDQIIIKYRSVDAATNADGALQADEIDRLSQAAETEVTYVRQMSGSAHVLRIAQGMTEAEVTAIAAKLAALPEIEYAEPDWRMFPLLTPNDTLYSSQWDLLPPGSSNYGIDAVGAWDISTGSSSVVVAVIDTGITNHPDLAGRLVAGYDFIHDPLSGNDGDGRDANPADPGDWISAAENASGDFKGCGVSSSSWHGTHVAGTIGAASNNKTGVAGINWAAQIQPIRVLGKCGGYTSDIADGARWAAGLAVTGIPVNKTPAKVLNLSLGGIHACDITTQNAINEITAAGAVFVVAAGNDNIDASGASPASCNGVITVASTGRAGSRAPYSNFGSVVEIAAPGGDQRNDGATGGILSTLNDGATSPANPNYVYYQGTSMAAPHVAGVASLLYSVAPALTPAQVLQILQQSATAFPAGSTCTTSICGAGILNAKNALLSLPRISATDPVSVTAGSQVTVTLRILGTNFNNTSAIAINQAAVATTFVNSGELRALLTPAMMSKLRWLSISLSGTTPYGNVTTEAKRFEVGPLNRTYLPIIKKAPLDWFSAPIIPTPTSTPTPPPGSGATPGFWKSTTGDEFYVTSDAAYIDDFSVYVSLPGCGDVKITHKNPEEPIVNNAFAFSGPFYASGSFNSPTELSGVDGLSGFVVSGCGTYNGGPWNFTANWTDSSQAAPDFKTAILVAPATGSEQEDPNYIIERIER